MTNVETLFIKSLIKKSILKNPKFSNKRSIQRANEEPKFAPNSGDYPGSRKFHESWSERECLGL